MTDANEYWYNIWHQAIANMPVRKCYQRRMDDPGNVGYLGSNDYKNIVPADGQMAALARCLGMNLYSKGGHFVAHNHIYTAMYRGYGPRDPKRRQLLIRLAGPYGRLFARVKLKKLGLAHRYHFE